MPDHDKNRITPEQFNQLSKTFESTNPLSSGLFNLDPLSKSNVIGGLTSLTAKALDATPIGALSTAANVAGNIQAENIASQLTGTPKNYMGALTGGLFDQNTALNEARSQADKNRDGIVSDREAQNYGMQKGMLTAYDVGVDASPPRANITFGSTSRSAFNRDLRDELKSSNFDPSRSAEVSDPANFSNKDFGPLGPPPDIGNQPQDPSPPPAEGGGDGGLTFICTVVFEKGDLPKNIYRYDQSYGSSVDKNIFEGYALWGEPLANLMKRNQLVYKIAKPIALCWANQMAFDLSNGVCGKKSITGKVLKHFGEPLCYALGFVINRRKRWLKSV